MPARRVLSVLAAPLLAVSLASSAAPGTLSTHARMTTAHVTKPALRCSTTAGTSVGIATAVPMPAAQLRGHRSPRPGAGIVPD
jgi:hypothetical protein